MINHNGKEYEKEYIYVYKKLNPFAVQQKLTHHWKSTIYIQSNKFFKKAAKTQEKSHY